MAIKSYVNEAQLDQTSLAIEQFLVAPYPQTWTPARVSDLTVGQLPTGFRHLGAVVEDSPSFRVTKEKFTLSTGLPRIRQYEAVIGLEGTLEFTLHSTSWRKTQIALGNLTAVSSATLMSSVLSVTDAQVFTLASSVTSLLTVGDGIVVATTANLDAIDQSETVIKSIVTNNGSLLTVYCVPAMPVTPTTASNVYRYDEVRQYYGTATQREYSLLGVAHFLDGFQIVHEFPRCQVAGDFERNIRPGENLRLPLTFNLFAVKRTIRGNDELILAQESYFPPRAV